MKVDAIVIKRGDNVATALRDIEPREMITVKVCEESKKISVQDKIPYGHKFAFTDIRRGDYILKYGEVMGRATSDIALGAYAHVQNIESLRGRGDLDSERK